MDVDVDLARIEEEGDDRVAVAFQQVGIGGADRAEEELVAHRPAVDEEKLRQAVGTAIGREAGETLQSDAFARRIDRKRVAAEAGADERGEADEPAILAARGGGLARRPVAADQREADARM